MDKHSGCVPLGWSGSGSIQDRPGSWFIKRTDESNLGKNSLVLLMHHDLSDLAIDPDPNHQASSRENFPDMDMAQWETHNNLDAVLQVSCCSRWETVRMLHIFIPFPSGCRIYFKWFVQLPAKEEYLFRLFATFPDWTGVSSGSGNVRKQVSRSGRSATVVWPTTDPRKEMIEDRRIFSQ